MQRIIILCSLILLCSCGALLNTPLKEHNARIGEQTKTTRLISSLPAPAEKIVAGVYRFRDQTGQFKATEVGANWSTAIPQGTTSILIKILDDSGWFTTIERENIGNLLNERQIIRTTRTDYDKNQSVNVKTGDIPPLLYAGILIEGGIVSYDTNVMTGGLGARYLGIGASSQYRQDRITVYLRAVSTSNGKILKSIYTSKTILSQSVSASLFRFVDSNKILENEIGFTKNEPVQLAVTSAMEKAVYELIMEGIEDGLWPVKKEDKPKYDSLQLIHKKELETNQNKVLGNRVLKTRRSKFSLSSSGEATMIRGDYNNQKLNYGFKGGVGWFLTPKLNLNANTSLFSLENKDVFKHKFQSVDLNLAFWMLPYDQVSPYVYGGIGTIHNLDESFQSLQFKSQFGFGIEFIPVKNLGIHAFSEYNVGFDDNWDGKIYGERKDHAIKFGLGINFYFGKSLLIP